MQYADHEFYTKEYKGSAIPAEVFDRFAVRASGFIDYITSDRAAVRAADNAVKMACCAVAEKRYELEREGGKILTSESLGSYSRSFKVDESDSEGKRCYNAAKLYLAHTGLLYRGG